MEMTPAAEYTREYQEPSVRDADESARKRAETFDRVQCIGMLAAVVIALVVVRLSSPTVLKPRIWTKEELAQYDGSDHRLPILLGILGNVFDVTKGRSHYGPGGGYSHFAGRDASRAFVSGNFTGEGLSDSLEGLSPLQVKSIMDWQNFFHNNSKYTYVGTLVGRFYDESGKATKEYATVTKLVARAERIIKKQKEDEKQFPSCNSRWSSQQGGEVWCTTGYPRIVEKISDGLYRGKTDSRCACFHEEALKKRKDLREYEGCEALSQKCQSAPPQE